MNVESIVIVLFGLFTCYHAQWSLDGKLSHGSGGPTAHLGVSHTSKSKKFKFNAGGHLGTGKNWGANIGFTWRFKRSAGKFQPLLDIITNVSPCNFGYYDGNKDGIITKQEMEQLFLNDLVQANRLFMALNSNKDGNGITRKEFYEKSSKVILECNGI